MGVGGGGGEKTQYVQMLVTQEVWLEQPGEERGGEGKGQEAIPVSWAKWEGARGGLKSWGIDHLCPLFPRLPLVSIF